jgi:hypothetical protein
MNKVGGAVLKGLLGIMCTAWIAIAACAKAPADVASIGSELDTKLFESFNSCDLDAFGELLAQDVEFYHDKDGLTVGRQAVVDAVRENICGKVRRELVARSLTSFPIDHYGLLQFGEHRFCTVGTSTCTGTGRFVHLWRQADGKWLATRVISYDHQPL